MLIFFAIKDLAVFSEKNKFFQKYYQFPNQWKEFFLRLNYINQQVD
jgi:hypothetical protein